MAKRYELIVFDWDGTLFDSTVPITRSIQASVADLGYPAPSDERASYVIGMGLQQALAHAAPEVPPEQYAALAQRYRHHYSRWHNEMTLFDGVLPLLDELKQRHHWLAVGTGKSRQGLNEVLQHVDLRHVFDATRTADETAGKPSPLMLFELMRELGVTADRVLMVGDTSHDLQMARNAGCDALGVSYGAHDGVSLLAYGPQAVVHSVNEMRGWLAEHA